MKLSIPKTARLPFILLIFTTSLILFAHFYNSKTKEAVDEINEIKSSSDYFLQKTTDDSIEHYVGEKQSSNYTVYVERQNQISHSIEKNPNKFEFQSIDDYLDKYGSTDIELFGPWYSEAGYKSYIFLKNGLIVVAHPISKAVAEIWSIPENLTQADFMFEFSKDFSDNEPLPPNNL